MEVVGLVVGVVVVVVVVLVVVAVGVVVLCGVDVKPVVVCCCGQGFGLSKVYLCLEVLE